MNVIQYSPDDVTNCTGDHNWIVYTGLLLLLTPVAIYMFTTHVYHQYKTLGTQLETTINECINTRF